MILHIDMDAFFASVEQLDNPQLRGKCLIVGGDSRRGVVAAASYEARKYGIHSAMPIYQARQRCPHLVIAAPRRQRYVEISQAVMAILSNYTPLVEPVSIDEAYMDVSGCRRLHGTPLEIAYKIKNEINAELHLTCSVGIAPKKFLAKIASEVNKPDGLTQIEPGAVDAFIDSLAIEKVPGVGPRAVARLRVMGIDTLADVNRMSVEALEKQFGRFGRRLVSLARGEDDSPVTPHVAVKSVSSEETLDRNTSDRHLLLRQLLQQSQQVAFQLRKKRLRARTVVLKLKFADFQLITRSRTLAVPTDASATIFKAVASLLVVVPLSNPVRLVGVGATGLVSGETPVQLSLFDSSSQARQNWEKVDRAIDGIHAKYGFDAVKRGVLANGKPSKNER